MLSQGIAGPRFERPEEVVEYESSNLGYLYALDEL